MWAIAFGAYGSVSNKAEAANTAQAVSATGGACPSLEIDQFVSAFAENQMVQRRYSAEIVDIAFVDGNAEPEPRETVKPMAREQLYFPVMPNRAQQAAHGLRYRLVSSGGERAVVALEVPDTDAQLIYTFRRDDCWTLIKVVDPAFDKLFQDVSASPGVGRIVSAAALYGEYQLSPGLSSTFVSCMRRAGSQTIARADCLMDERDRQDARLNRVYRELVASLQDDRRTRLVEAQRIWVQLQQKDGAFKAAILDDLGLMGNLDSLEIEVQAIAQRADRLESYLELSSL